MSIPTTPRPAPAVPVSEGSAAGIPSRYVPFAAAMDSLVESSRTMVWVQSRPFPDDPLRTAYIVTGPSAEAVQRSVADIMESVGNGWADFTLPYRAGLSWEAKGVTERAP